MKRADGLQKAKFKLHGVEQDVQNNALVCQNSEGKLAGGTHTCVSWFKEAIKRARERVWTNTCFSLTSFGLILFILIDCCFS
jgi:N-acetylglucosamine-6-phosphate deacetylase